MAENQQQTGRQPGAWQAGLSCCVFIERYPSHAHSLVHTAPSTKPPPTHTRQQQQRPDLFYPVCEHTPTHLLCCVQCCLCLGVIIIFKVGGGQGAGRL